MAEAIEAVEEPEEEEGPKCPPVGAPAWMATFADMATLLMAFFVLILSFAEFNQPKFKMVAGSLKNAFGVQRRVPVVEQPKGTNVIKLEFSPSPEPSVRKEITQETTETEKPEVKTPQSEEQALGGEKEQAADQEQQKAAQELAEALQQALQDGRVKAETKNGEVVMTFDAPDPQSLPSQLSAAAEALQQAGKTTGQPTENVLMGGLSEALGQMAAATEAQAQGNDGEGEEGEAARKAAIAEAELRVALRREVAEGLVTVEQREDRVVVTVGAGGAFPSGDADLTAEARDVMARLAFSAMGDASNIVVTGHTDTVPLSSGSPYRDNWGLAAAWASSVVRELGGSGLIDPTRLTAISRGETMPVADNETYDGREQNRRIEIEITY
jgi:chemotaxis protein MotB